MLLPEDDQLQANGMLLISKFTIEPLLLTSVVHWLPKVAAPLSQRILYSVVAGRYTLPVATHNGAADEACGCTNSDGQRGEGADEGEGGEPHGKMRFAVIC